MNKRVCINLHYRNLREVKIMERMHVHHGNVEKELSWVERWSPKERAYTCGSCPSDGLCRYVNRYRFAENRKE